VEFNGEVDLHCFAAADIPTVLDALLAEAILRSIARVRVITGKGRSVKKAAAINYLQHDPRVSSLREEGANWGRLIAAIKLPSAF
jgi:DNA-nicking Smr family endonuclease